MRLEREIKCVLCTEKIQFQYLYTKRYITDQKNAPHLSFMVKLWYEIRHDLVSNLIS